MIFIKKNNKIMGITHRLKEYEKKLFKGFLVENVLSNTGPVGDEMDLMRDLNSISGESNLNEYDDTSIINMDPHSIALDIKGKLPKTPNETDIFDVLCDMGYGGNDSGRLLDSVMNELVNMGVDVSLTESLRENNNLIRHYKITYENPVGNKPNKILKKEAVFLDKQYRINGKNHDNNIRELNLGNNQSVIPAKEFETMSENKKNKLKQQRNAMNKNKMLENYITPKLDINPLNLQTYTIKENTPRLRGLKPGDKIVIAKSTAAKPGNQLDAVGFIVTPNQIFSHFKYTDEMKTEFFKIYTGYSNYHSPVVSIQLKFGELTKFSPNGLNEAKKTKLSESGTPGISMYEKIHGESGTSNKSGVKRSMDNAKRLNKVADKTENEKLSGIGKGEPKYGNFDKNKKQYDDDYIGILRGMGLQDIQFDSEPAEDYKTRAKEAIVGSSRMGNNPEWANAQRDFDGTRGELGEKIINTANKKKEMVDAGNKEDKWNLRMKYPNKKHGKTHIATEGKNIQNLKTKKLIHFHKDIDDLIPESHKIEGARFKLLDGKNTLYELKWEGGTIVLEKETNKTIVESERNLFKKMSNYSVGEYKVKPKGYLIETKQ